VLHLQFNYCESSVLISRKVLFNSGLLEHVPNGLRSRFGPDDSEAVAEIMKTLEPGSHAGKYGEPKVESVTTKMARHSSNSRPPSRAILLAR